MPKTAEDKQAADEALQKYPDQLVASCTLAHAVSIRGTETRTVSLSKLDFKSAGLQIVETDRGLEISYSGTDSKRNRLITPWANVVEYRYV